MTDVEIKESRGKQIVSIAMGKFLSLMAMLMTPFFLSRTLTTQDYGYYLQFITATDFLVLICCFGFHSSLFYFFPHYDESKHRAITGNVYFVLVLSAILIGVVLAFPVTGLAIVGQNGLYDYAPYLILYIVFFLPCEMMTSFYIVKKDTATSVWFPPLLVVSKAVIAVVVALLGGDIRTIFLYIVVFQGALLVFTTNYYWQQTQYSGNTALFDWRLFKKQIVYTVPFGLASVLSTLALRLDKMICIAYLTPSDYAVYAIAFLGVPGLELIYQSIGNVYLVGMSESFHRQDKKAVLLAFHDLVVRVMSFSIPAILIVCLYANEIIEFVYTPQYLAAVPFFRIYLFSFLVVKLGATYIARASGNTSTLFWSYFYTAPLTIPFTYFMIKYYGSWGGIAGVMTSTILPKFFVMYYESKIVGTSLYNYFPLKKIGRIAVVSLVLFIPFYVVHQFGRQNIWICLAESVIYFSVIFVFELKLKVALVSQEFIAKKLTKYRLTKVLYALRRLRIL